MDGMVTPEKREQILRQMQAQLVKMMGNVEGMEQHVRTWEQQSYDLSKGIQKDYIARMANRLQKIENKLKQQQLQQQQPTMQQQQQPQIQQPQHISQQQMPQHVLQPQAQSRFAPQQPQAQPHHGQVMPTIPTRAQGSSRMQLQEYGMYAMHDAQAGHSHPQPTHMDQQQPDNEIFADMAQAFILGPDVGPPPQQQQQQQTFQQQHYQQRQNMGYSPGAMAYSPAQQVPMQTWQQQQQQQYGNNGGMQQPQPSYNSTQPQPSYNTVQTQYNQGSPAFYGMQQQAPMYPQQQQQQQQQRMHAQHQQQGVAAGSPIATEQYWTLLEEMRAEYLGDLEEYVGYARMNDRNPQPSDKMNKMLNIVARLSMRREQNLHRDFTVKDVQVLQGLQQQLRMYVAKLRTILEALRKARPTSALAGYNSGLKRQETENAGLPQAQPTQGPGTPSETQLTMPASTFHPNVVQAVKQFHRVDTPTAMPTPPGTSPGEGKIDLMGEAAAKAEWEKASATPSERLIRQLAGARADKLAAAADSAKAVAMRIGSDVSSPPLPIRLKRPEPDASHLQEPSVVRSYNVNKTSEPHSPDSVLDIRSASKRQRSQQETKVLQTLRQKIEAECSQLETSVGAKFNIRECEDVESALVISATVPSASAQQPQSSDAEGAGTWRCALHMRVDAAYPSQPPVLLFPETLADGRQDAKVRALQGAFEEAVAAKAYGANVGLKFLVETWAKTWGDATEKLTAAV